MKIKKNTWVAYVGTESDATLGQVIKSSPGSANVWLDDGTIGDIPIDDLIVLTDAVRSSRCVEEHSFHVEPNLFNTASTLNGSVLSAEFVAIAAFGDTPETLERLSISIHGPSLSQENDYQDETAMIEFGTARAHLETAPVPGWVMGLIGLTPFVDLVTEDRIESHGHEVEVASHEITTHGTVEHRIEFTPHPRLQLLDEHQAVEFSPDTLVVTESGYDFYGALDYRVHAEGDSGDSRVSEFLTDQIPDWVERIAGAGMDLAALDPVARARSAA